ncbi:hypothetical protein [Hymenobacter crusticola]|uniref:Uncharacterized protein n=1 Tax=Hymenobacter crusticola TaxID=1770526 RepID=A0A243W9A0_9BACT|nr:hypothetical protein [Hymenobacter crusticola]OUJ71847.1 hypothetical protein BXP70_21080 [Hymenobacter crusticola]
MNSVVLTLASLFTTQAGFRTIDGQFISSEIGQRALQNGSALLVGGLLIGDFSSDLEIIAHPTAA